MKRERYAGKSFSRYRPSPDRDSRMRMFLVFDLPECQGASRGNERRRVVEVLHCRTDSTKRKTASKGILEYGKRTFVSRFQQRFVSRESDRANIR